MKCKNCGNILACDAVICPLCGNSDLEKINSDFNTNQNVNLNSSINIEPNPIINNNATINNINYEKQNKLNKKTSGIIFTVLSLTAVIVLVIITFLNKQKITGDYSGSTVLEFENYMKQNDYSLTDLAKTNSNYSYFDNYYVARKNNNNYSVVFIYSKEKNTINKYFDNIKSTITKNETNMVTNKVDVSITNFSKYSILSKDKYEIVAKTDNTIMYSNVNSGYANKIDKIFDELGYSYNIEDNSLIFIIIAGLIIMLLFLVSLWKIFVKAGRHGIFSIIPIYNLYCLTDIAIGNGWLFFIAFIPLVNIIFSIYLLYKLAKMFGKNIFFAIGMILFSIIFIPALAFDNSDYLGIKRI